MTIEYTYEDASNISYTSCVDHSSTFFDGFRKDKFLTSVDPTVFGDNPTAPEETAQKVISRLGAKSAPSTYIKILSGKFVLCNAYEGNQCLASCLFKLPASQVIKLSFTQQVKLYYNKAYAYIIGLIQRFFTDRSSSFNDPEVRGFFERMHNEGTGPHGPEYYAELAKMSFNDLKTARYPIDDTLYVNILSVRQAGQGKGVGSKLLCKSLEKFHIEDAEFKSGDNVSHGPAKTSLFPTEGKDKFYEKYGFNVVHRTDDFHPFTKKPMQHLFMQRLLYIE